jgi:sterol desaturase/sphingolipid hydroxylase (fatty acid hydroxylase superfamily)
LKSLNYYRMAVCSFDFSSHCRYRYSRANVDAINVHPLEFFLGEYNYIWTLFLCCHVFQLFQLHVLGALIFLVAGGVLAGLNHTRFDIVISLFEVPIFDSKFHDVHHRIPQSNYGQYTMFWDYVFGTFRYV